MRKALLVTGLALAFVSCGEKDNSKKEVEDTPNNVNITSVGELTIGYYEMDSIATSFSFYVNTQKDLEAKRKSFEGKLKGLQDKYARAAETYQKGMQNQTLTQNNIEALQRKMREAEEESYRLQQTEGMRIEQESMQANEVLTNKIDLYATEFAKKNQLKLMFSKAKGGQLVFADPAFDMTTEFIDFINKRETELQEEINED